MYLTIMNMLAFVAPALFMFTIHIAMFAFRDWFFGNVLSALNDESSFNTTEFYNSFVFVMDFIYIILMLGLVFKSIHFTHRT
jgi:small basic protein